MRTGSKPEQTKKPLRAVDEEEYNMDVLLETIVGKLKGKLVTADQLEQGLRGGVDLRESGGPNQVTEDTPGYCYLRLLDEECHADAISLGAYPTVAELRRFTNSRPDPFSSRPAKAYLRMVEGRVRAHIVDYAGVHCMHPVSILSALAKNVRVGGTDNDGTHEGVTPSADVSSNPDGVYEDFPPHWIPADFKVAQTWDYTMGDRPKPLDCLGWIGDRPSWLSNKYESVSSASSKIKWVLRANPLGSDTSMIDVIDPSGRVQVVRQWTSKVAHTGYHQGWAVRGHKVFAEAYIWRAARILTDPSAPTPAPSIPSSGDHGELLKLGPNVVRVDGHTSDVQGYCYSRAFADQIRACAALGAFPTVGEVLDYARALSIDGGGLQDGASASWGAKAGFQWGENGVHHVTDDARSSNSFWSAVKLLPFGDRLGATQPESVLEHEQASAAPLLTLPARGQGMVLHVPFTAKLDARLPYFTWNLAVSGKVKAITDYFESCELESLTVKALLHKGDADSMLTVVAESGKIGYENDMAWVGATHALHLSGNSNGGTSGELVLSGNHGFGTQLKGLALGNPTPYLQAKFDSTAGAVAYLRIMLVIRVSGAGLPGSVVILSKAAPATGAAEVDTTAEEVPSIRHRGTRG